MDVNSVEFVYQLGLINNGGFIAPPLIPESLNGFGDST